MLRASGKGVREIFRDEAGGHRWQRVPPNEKRGRVHTSTITVAVLDEPNEREMAPLDPRDLDISTCRASGSGGQHLQKTDSAVQVRHVPTGLVVRCETERSQSYNRETALSILRARLHEHAVASDLAARANDRRRQIGSGQRGDKRRTIAVQRDSVVDHQSGRSWRYDDYARGKWD
ncbi:MAG: peptide chain release factor-like protein [Kofleriaceae bacterium]